MPKVELLAVVLQEVLQRSRIVVQPHRAGIGHAERVEQIGRIEARKELDAPPAGKLGQLELSEFGTGVRRSDCVVIRQKRVHPVDGDEFLRHRKRYPVVIGGRTGNTADADRCLGAP